jgi:hypothetical protein
MSREILFRAFIKGDCPEDSHMIYFDKLDDHDFMIDISFIRSEFVISLEAGDCDVLGMLWDQPKFELMQYIGKKDLNKKRIFDGDIIRDCFGREFTIFFCDDHSRWEMKGSKEDGFNYGVHISDWFDGLSDFPVIIGNVHEGAANA